MTRIYGHKWTSVAESDDGTWLAGLMDLTPDHISVGLGNLLKSGDEWPPSLIEFREMCLDLKTGCFEHISDAYKDYIALPKPERLEENKNMVRDARAEIKNKLGKKQ